MTVRVLLYTGKGGVGKTTTAAATAAWAAERGLRTLVLSADSAHSLGDVLTTRLSAEPLQVASNLWAVEIDARAEMALHWKHIREYLLALFRYQGIEEVVAEELSLLPGAEELSTLFAVDRLATSEEYELIVVDCAPTDTALRLATLPEVAHASMRLVLRVQRAIAAVATPLASAVTPVPLPESSVFADVERLVFQSLKRLRARLLNEQTSVRLVVTPERMVIDEGRRAFTEFALFDLTCDRVVMNRMLPEDALREKFFEQRGALEKERLEEVRGHFAPLPILVAPLREDEVCGVEALASHGRALFDGGDPAEAAAVGERMRFERSGGGYRVRVPLPGVRPSDLDVVKLDDELIVRVGGRRRAIKLPTRMTTCALDSARIDGAVLQVTLGPPERAGRTPLAGN